MHAFSITLMIYCSWAVATSIDEQYIVALKEQPGTDGIDDVEIFREILTQRGNEETEMTMIHILGKRHKQISFLVVRTSPETIQMINHLDGVKYTELNSDVCACSICIEVEARDMWGLDRIDQRMEVKHYMPRKRKYHYSNKDSGYGTTVYIVDSGITEDLPRHFDSRIRQGFSYTGDFSLSTNHGTYMAGIIGSNIYGVANRADMVSVKVLGYNDCGTIDAVLRGLEWIFIDYHNMTSTPKKAVVNLSICGAVSQSLDDAVRILSEAGITVIVAAGNNAADACQASPGRVSRPDAITIGAINKYDNVYYQSNIGECVDIFAPGENIPSVRPDGNKATTSGTSQSAASVTGVVARYLSAKNTFQPPAQVWQFLNGLATYNAINFIVNTTQETSPNRLVYISCYDDDNGVYDSGTILTYNAVSVSVLALIGTLLSWS